MIMFREPHLKYTFTFTLHYIYNTLHYMVLHYIWLCHKLSDGGFLTLKSSHPSGHCSNGWTLYNLFL